MGNFRQLSQTREELQGRLDRLRGYQGSFTLLPPGDSLIRLIASRVRETEASIRSTERAIRNTPEWLAKQGQELEGRLSRLQGYSDLLREWGQDATGMARLFRNIKHELDQIRRQIEPEPKKVKTVELSLESGKAVYPSLPSTTDAPVEMGRTQEGQFLIRSTGVEQASVGHPRNSHLPTFLPWTRVKLSETSWYPLKTGDCLVVGDDFYQLSVEGERVRFVPTEKFKLPKETTNGAAMIPHEKSGIRRRRGCFTERADRFMESFQHDPDWLKRMFPEGAGLVGPEEIQNNPAVHLIFSDGGREAQDFLKQKMAPISSRLFGDQITPQQAVKEVWSLVKSDHGADLFHLRVALQYLGIPSETKRGEDGTLYAVATVGDDTRLNLDFELQRPWEVIQFGRLPSTLTKFFMETDEATVLGLLKEFREMDPGDYEEEEQKAIARNIAILMLVRREILPLTKGRLKEAPLTRDFLLEAYGKAVDVNKTFDGLIKAYHVSLLPLGITQAKSMRILLKDAMYQGNKVKVAIDWVDRVDAKIIADALLKVLEEKKTRRLKALNDAEFSQLLELVRPILESYRKFREDNIQSRNDRTLEANKALKITYHQLRDEATRQRKNLSHILGEGHFDLLGSYDDEVLDLAPLIREIIKLENRAPYAPPDEVKVQDRVLTPGQLSDLLVMDKRNVARAILANRSLGPYTTIKVEPLSFYFTRPIVSHDYLYVLALVPVPQGDGTVLLDRKFFYKSASGGNWRASPYMIMAHLAKGRGEHYTQETQPVPEIRGHLNLLFGEGQDPGNPFHPLPMPQDKFEEYIHLGSPLVGQKTMVVMLEGFGQEVLFPPVQGLTAIRDIQPGMAFKGHRVDDSIPGKLQNLSYPSGFVPDFTQTPARVFEDHHTLLGTITVREYGGSFLAEKGNPQNKRPVIWSMAEDSQGRTWIESIRFADSKVTSYGVYAEVINSGILTSKPLEYRDQAGSIPPACKKDFNDRYVDITPLLHLLEPIRRYREARGDQMPSPPVPGTRGSS